LTINGFVKTKNKAIVTKNHNRAVFRFLTIRKTLTIVEMAIQATGETKKLRIFEIKKAIIE